MRRWQQTFHWWMFIQVNAVRATFKAGITPSRIAPQFGISQSNVRKALDLVNRIGESNDYQRTTA
jgi:transposase-like protein